MKKTEPILKVGETTFYLESFANISFARFQEIYCPNGIKINGIKWDVKPVWELIQAAMIKNGLREDNGPLKKINKR